MDRSARQTNDEGNPLNGAGRGSFCRPWVDGEVGPLIFKPDRASPIVTTTTAFDGSATPTQRVRSYSQPNRVTDFAFKRGLASRPWLDGVPVDERPIVVKAPPRKRRPGMATVAASAATTGTLSFGETLASLPAATSAALPAGQLC